MTGDSGKDIEIKGSSLKWLVDRKRRNIFGQKIGEGNIQRQIDLDNPWIFFADLYWLDPYRQQQGWEELDLKRKDDENEEKK